MRRLKIPTAEYDSIVRLIRSQINLSLSRRLSQKEP